MVRQQFIEIFPLVPTFDDIDILFGSNHKSKVVAHDVATDGVGSSVLSKGVETLLAILFVLAEELDHVDALGFRSRRHGDGKRKAVVVTLQCCTERIDIVMRRVEHRAG